MPLFCPVVTEATTEAALPMDSCALPVEPQEENVDLSQGYRFGEYRKYNTFGILCPARMMFRTKGNGFSNVIFCTSLISKYNYEDIKSWN